MGKVRIQDWDYLISYPTKGCFTVWHHVTPADGGYGTEVCQEYRVGAFTRDTVDRLYDDISSRHISPRPHFFNREEEIEALIREMEQLGLLAE